MKALHIGALALTCLLFSCKKESDEDVTTGPGTGGDYFPSTAGSSWNLSSTSLGNYTVTSLGTDSTINGKKYFKFDNSKGGRQYLNKENGVYTTYAHVPEIGQSVNMIVLKDAAVGTTWTNTVTVNGIPMSYTYKVISAGTDKTVDGKTYKDVIAIEYTVSMKEPTTGTTFNFGKGRQYYAKGIGGIAGAFEVGMPGNTVTDSTYLKSYIIK